MVTDLRQNIIGMDLMSRYGLCLDTATHQITQGPQVPGTIVSLDHPPASVYGIKIDLPEATERYQPLVKEFQAIFRPFNALASSVTTRVSHKIELIAPLPSPPVITPLSHEKHAAAVSDMETLKKAGIVKRSDSNFASPVVVVRKNNQPGQWRVCGNYKALNAVTKPDYYPLPNQMTLLRDVAGFNVYSKLDLQKAYNQIPMDPESTHLTAVRFPGGGSHEYLCMPFGLRNAGQTFQRYIEDALEGLSFVRAYIDDLIIYSDNHTDHLDHLRQVFDRLQKAGLVCSPGKCIIGVSKLRFLGHEVSSEGQKPLQEKVQPIQDFPIPRTVRQLRKFIGMIGYYRRFIPKLAKVISPWNKMLIFEKKTTRKSWPIRFGEDDQARFIEAKRLIVEAVLLTAVNWSKPFELETDASDTAIGAVLQQRFGDVVKPVAFFSRKLVDRETRYDTFGKELLAIYAAVIHFDHFLDGHRFTIKTDHKPLVHALGSNSRMNYSRRVNSQLTRLSEYDYDIEHIKGSDNVVADALSRPDEPDELDVNAISDDMTPPISLKDIKDAQSKDPVTNELAVKPSYTMVSLQDGMRETEPEPRVDGPVAVRNSPTVQYSVLCDISTANPRPYIPKELRYRMIDQIHRLGHTEAPATAKKVSERFFWPGMVSDVHLRVRTCHGCQVGKIHKHTKLPSDSIPIPPGRFQCIHVDIVNFPPEGNYTGDLLSIRDRFSRQFEVMPLTSSTAHEVIYGILMQWVARYGVPVRIVCDNGPQFKAAIFASTFRAIGAEVHYVTPYNKKSNGMIERLHRELRGCLRTLGNSSWVSNLPLAMLAMRGRYREQLKTSIAELVYGETLRLPGDFFEPIDEESRWSDDATQHLVNSLRQRMNALIPTETRVRRSQCQLDKNLGKSGFVYVRRETISNKMAPLYQGPFKILSMAEKSAQLLIRGKPKKVAKERLKTAYIWNDAEPETTEHQVSCPTAPSAGERPPRVHPVQPACESATDEAQGDEAMMRTHSGRSVKPVRKYGLHGPN